MARYPWAKSFVKTKAGIWCFESKKEALAYRAYRTNNPIPGTGKAPKQENPMAYVKTFPNGFQMWVGRLTKEQEAEFYRRFGDAPIAWHRGSAPNLGPTKPAKPKKGKGKQ